LEVIACRLPKDYCQAFESAIINDKLQVKYGNLRKRSEEGKINFVSIFNYFYCYRFHLFGYYYHFHLGLKNRKKKLENDFQKSDIIIFVFIPIRMVTPLAGCPRHSAR